MAVSGHELNAVLALPGVAHFQGEECGAFVVADTEEIAENALKLIKVEWEQRPFVLDVEKAIEPGAPLTHPHEFPDSNMSMVYNEKHGDVEKGFAEADKIIEFKWTFGYNTWVGPERPCGVWRWNGDFAEVWVKQQRPHIAKRAISTWFGGIPMSKIDLHCPYQGASFGGWSQMSWNLGGTYWPALASKRTGRPVKWAFNRREDFYGGNMDSGVFYVKVGFKLDGTITAVYQRGVTLNQDMPVFGIVAHLIENTKIPHIAGRTEAAWVNKGPTVPTRCEMNINCYTLNLVFNHVADALGMDPVEVALLNDGAEGHDMEWLNERKAEIGFPVRDSLQGVRGEGQGRHRLGREVARARRQEAAQRQDARPGLHLDPRMGRLGRHQRDRHVLRAQRRLGHHPRLPGRRGRERRDRLLPDRRRRAGRARGDGALQAPGRRRLLHHDARHLHQPGHQRLGGRERRPHAQAAAARGGRRAPRPRPSWRSTRRPSPASSAEDLDVKDGVIFEKADPSNSMSIADFIGPGGRQGPAERHRRRAVLHLARKRASPTPCAALPPSSRPPGTSSAAATWACACASAARPTSWRSRSTPRPARWTSQKVVTVNDVGKVINWDGCEGQAYGGAIMGIGRGMTEEVVYDPRTGVMLNGNLLNYKIPTMMDYGDIETIMVETGMGYGPYGSIGIGEDVATVLPALIGPAVQNAIGVWVDDFPITPDRVLAALGKA